MRRPKSGLPIKFAVGIEKAQNQRQRLAEIRSTRTSGLLAVVEHRRGKDLANHRDLVIGRHRPVLEPRFPFDQLSFAKRVCGINGNRHFKRPPLVSNDWLFINTAWQQLDCFVLCLRVTDADFDGEKVRVAQSKTGARSGFRAIPI